MSEKKRLRAVVIDGQGGGLGRQIVTALRKEWDGTVLEITAVGTNSAATAAMHKAGADHAATGENAVIVAARRADVIIGPIGIVIADALWGEISPAMAVAVGQSAAKRILIPVNQCGNIVAGVSDLRISALLDAACDEIRALL
ncbi:MAG: DUF3842 family protein [Clostridia bacterium]|nr:DUF3842 family protein [Clostridia bacterium]